MVSRIEPSGSGSGPGLSKVRIQVFFEEDHHMYEFGSELSNLYQAPQGSPAAKRLAEFRSKAGVKNPNKIPKILMFSEGSKVPVRYDAPHRTRFVVDGPALEMKALDEYLKIEEANIRRNAARAAKDAPPTGPPWDVPAICPTCGAPVDQAKASMAADPMCVFCHQPIPAKPLARA